MTCQWKSMEVYKLFVLEKHKTRKQIKIKHKKWSKSALCTCTTYVYTKGLSEEARYTP